MRKLEPKKVLLYGLMLTGAIVGLAIDRLRGPEAAEAASSGPLTDSGAGNAAAGRTEEVHGPAIARVFEAATPEKQATQPTAGPPRDAFGLTDELRRHFEELSPTRKAEQVRQAESEEERRRQQAEQFLGSHRLKGTTLRDGEAWAIINDRIVRVGEHIDGFELQRVERYRAFLAKDDLSVVLSLPLPY